MINVLKTFDDKVLDIFMEKFLPVEELLEASLGAVSKWLAGNECVSR